MRSTRSQPNSLGYCGPDENGKILEHLHDSSVSEDLTTMLSKFEAAYPFVRMIAKSTGMSPFDKAVTEAYGSATRCSTVWSPRSSSSSPTRGLGSG